MMAVDRQLLIQVLDELVGLKSGAENPMCFIVQLYASALVDWVERLGVDLRKLKKRATIRETVSSGRLH
jgi:hypothetical protein